MRWNHNLHYHRVVLDAAPPGAKSALDVGAGDGLLAADLRDRLPRVTAIDVDLGVVARAQTLRPDVGWVVGDVLTHPLPPASFDVVASIATVHHLPDLGAALRRLAELTAPGGVLVVIGCARSAGPADFAMDVVGAIQHRVLTRTRGFWQHSAPVVMAFPHTYAEARDIATAALPGVRWRRLPLFRYALTWSAPA